MPKDFKEFAAKELAHAKEIIAWLDTGQWPENPELRRHYKGVVQELERLLGFGGGS